MTITTDPIVYTDGRLTRHEQEALMHFCLLRVIRCNEEDFGGEGSSRWEREQAEALAEHLHAGGCLEDFELMSPAEAAEDARRNEGDFRRGRL